MNSKLKESAFKKLHISQLHPEGWLKQQLKIQAEGLSGNLDKFWPDIKDSQWIGGAAEGWERVPYWLDGFLPLAWLLDDNDMKARAQKYIDYIINNQLDDGWICPDNKQDRANYDIWPMFLILKVMVLYYELSEDERVEGVIHKALLSLDRHIDGHTIFNWAHTRWFECLISIWWLYERTREEWLLNLATKLSSQGFNWQKLFKYWPYKKPDVKGRWSQMSHVVNNAMMLKSGALLWRMTGCKEDIESAEIMIEHLEKYHGMVTGVFTGDECLAGTSPIQGTELCAVAEYMYSLEELMRISGKPIWGDRLEKIAFNALPATFSPDMWTHQYDQQVNQVECSIQKIPVFLTNSGESHLFGLEPNFGCCTANLSQPWPKFALSTFLRSPEGLVSAVLAPVSATACINGANVSIVLETDYPFDDILNYTVKTDKEIEFSFSIRIPQWAEGAEINIDGQSYRIQSGDYHKIDRNWSGVTAFYIKLPMKPIVIPRPNNLYSIARGPLVYSLPIEEKWLRINKDMPGHEAPHCDYEIYPQSPWNYALCIDRNNPDTKIKFEKHSVGTHPFSPSGAPITAKVYGRKIDWKMENGSVTPFPVMEWISENIEELTLIPYGCTNLRMTEMPII